MKGLVGGLLLVGGLGPGPPGPPLNPALCRSVHHLLVSIPSGDALSTAVVRENV